jgi:hypothetical protein
MIEILKQTADGFLNKYIVFYCGIFVFCMPAFYRIRLFFETRRNVKMRTKAMFQMCNTESFWVPDIIPELDLINESVKSFSFINIVSQALFDIKLFENDEPADNIGFKDCKMIPMYSLNHYSLDFGHYFLNRSLY